MITRDTVFYWEGIAIHEPVTVITNIILTVMCLGFYLKFLQLKSTEKEVLFWSYFFLGTAIATFIGVFVHACFPIRDGFAYKSMWLPMQFFNILSTYFMQLATLHTVLKFSKKSNFYYKISTLQFVLFIPAIFIFQNYNVVTIYSALALIPIMFMHFMHAKKEPTYLWIGYGISVLLITAYIHTSKFSIHKYFNYLDIAHVLLMIFFTFCYIGSYKKAATLIKDSL